jgi:hypothetical protein
MKPFDRASAMLTVLLALSGCGGDTTNGEAGGGSGAAGKGSATAGAGNAGGGSSSGGNSSNGGATGDTCPSSECGPALGLPNTPCADGSVAGPTGRCLRLESGGCGWEVRQCPSSGEGGASAAGSASTAGDAGASGAASGGSAGAAGTPATDRCGGCDYGGPAPEICILQVGGPGPGGFECATQNPCGASGACACIVGQGTCDSTLQGGSPGYCVCDNGLD